MGFLAAYVPQIIAAAVAVGATAYNSNETANKQDQAAALDIYDQQGYQDKINASVTKATAARNASTSAPFQQQRLAQYTAALAGGKPQIQQGLTTPGGTSQAFKDDGSSAALGISNYANRAASLMSRIDAPTLQRQQEGFQDANLGLSVGNTARDAQGQHFIDQMKLRSIHPSPWLDALSKVAGAYAGGFGGAGGAAASAASDVGYIY